jgi:hypothetical protein
MKKATLAATLAVIGREESELENQATAVLRVVRAQKITDLAGWSAAVRAAYKANGWNGKPGKPKAGNTAATVPATVKQYVSQIRAAFRLKLPVSSYTSFYALREDLKKHAARKAARAVNAHDQRPELAGVRLIAPEQLTGAPFHDLAVLFNALDGKRKPMMLNALARVRREFAQSVPHLVMDSVPGLKKAA